MQNVLTRKIIIKLFIGKKKIQEEKNTIDGEIIEDKKDEL